MQSYHDSTVDVNMVDILEIFELGTMESVANVQNLGKSWGSRNFNTYMVNVYW